MKILDKIKKIEEIKEKLYAVKKEILNHYEELKEEFICEYIDEKQSIIDNNISVDISNEVLDNYDYFLNSFDKWDFEFEFKKLDNATLSLPLTKLKDRKALEVLVNKFLVNNNLGMITFSSISYNEEKNYKLTFIVDFKHNINKENILKALDNEKALIRVK